MPGPAAFRTLKQAARNFVTDPPRGLRELPGRGIRVAVIGVGRALLLADRVREEYQGVRRDGVGSTVTRLRTKGASTSGYAPAAQSGAPPASEQPKSAAPEESPAPTAPHAAERPSTATPSTPKPPAPAQTSGPAASDLPVPSYDDLSVPSLRARLRNLTVEQVEQLRDYEKAHAERESVITMYDNRIAKLREEQPGT